MKLLQLNIWQGRLLLQILKLIDQVKPDLLCLQEVFSSDGLVVTPEHMFNSLEIIQKQTGYAYSFFSPTFTTVYSGVKASFGNAIISRYPLVDSRTIFTNGSFVTDYNPSTFDINIRNLQLARVEANGQSYTIANHHAHWVIDPLGDATSVSKMKRIRTEFEKIATPLIFAADLNVTAKSKSMRVLDGLLDDLTATHNVTTTLSSVGKVAGVACDHILVSPEVQVKDFQVRHELVSDHRALILDFEL